jgi:hypothetical protein
VTGRFLAAAVTEGTQGLRQLGDPGAAHLPRHLVRIERAWGRLRLRSPQPLDCSLRREWTVTGPLWRPRGETGDSERVRDTEVMKNH